MDKLERNSGLNRLVLLGMHIAGCLMMLSPPLLLAAAGGGAAFLYNHISGPLDWFIFQVLAATSLFAGYLCWQLLALRPQADEGIAVEPTQAPELYAMLERRSGHFNTKTIDRINLSTKTVLKVVATPVLPLPFRHRRALLVGAPLLFFLTHRQFRLALAGTVAASVAETSALNRWLAQACIDWPLIVDSLEARSGLLARLLGKPMCAIATVSARLGRSLQTDWREQQGQWVRDNSDEQNLVDYLANQVAAEVFLDKQYWPMILKAAERSPTPVVKAFSHLPLLLEKTLNQTNMDRWLLQAQTTSSNEHNNLRDLLAALQIEHLRWRGLPEQNAFSTLFSSSAPLKQLDSYWQNEIEVEWTRRHQQFKSDQARFENLKQQADEHNLHGESALRFIKLAERFMDPKDAATYYRRTLEINKTDAKVCFACGLGFLRAGAINAGVSVLQHAASLEPLLAKRAQALINEQKTAWLDETANADQQAQIHQAIA